MKIVILNGSPRANGNAAAMVEAFARGAKEAGHAEVRRARRARPTGVGVAIEGGRWYNSRV